jgi:thymidine kinase
MSLDIIIGPMFSGKTTELIRRLTSYDAIGKKCVYVNSSMDTRDSKNFSTHNPVINSLNIDSMKVDTINYKFIESVKGYDVIGIDESQLFTGVIDICVQRLVDDLNKIVIISGLNGDYKKHKFGRILDMIPHCDSVIKLYPYCKKCADEGRVTRALFSKKIDNDCVIEIGYDNYIPVCRKCY